MIKAFGLVYEVQLCDRMEDSGCFDAGEQVIQISAEQHKQQQQRALFHECLELVVCELCIPISHEDLSRIETGLFHVLTSNGVVIESLMNVIDYTDENVQPISGFGVQSNNERERGSEVDSVCGHDNSKASKRRSAVRGRRANVRRPKAK